MKVRYFPWRIQQLDIPAGDSQTQVTIYYSDTTAPYVLKRESVTTDAGGKNILGQPTFEVMAIDLPWKIRDDIKSVACIKTVQRHAKGTVTSLAMTSAAVPGGIVFQTSKETDPGGRMTRRSVLELVNYGLHAEDERSRPARPQASAARQVEFPCGGVVRISPLALWEGAGGEGLVDCTEKCDANLTNRPHPSSPLKYSRNRDMMSPSQSTGGTTMALGKRQDEQQEMWVATTSLPKSEGHVFYRKLNEVLAEAKFDRTVERMCQPYYHTHRGRPSIPPGVYFRMLLVGYFEGIGSQRGIAWRCGDSLSLRQFLGIPLTEETPDHSSLTRVRDRLPLEVHAAVFQWVLKLVAEKGLLRGKTVAVDATTLEANAAMKSIVRRDSGEDWNEYLRRLLQEEQGVENPTDEELRRFDKQRKDKKVSNAEWQSPTDPDSRIAKMKDGRTHLAYKAEHVVDLKTEVVLAASIRHADEADTDTMVDSVVEAQLNLSEAGIDVEIEEAVADKGYHATDTLELADWLGVRTYIPERKTQGKGRRNWEGVPEEKRRAVLNNRRRTQGRGASGCSVCGANWWNAVSPMCARRAVPGEVGFAGSRRCKSVT